jgi:hypothetical protein
MSLYEDVAHSLLLPICKWDNVHQKSTNLSTSMSYDITPGNPEMISDEQLEEVAGGLADVENNSWVALYQATAQINL